MAQEQISRDLSPMDMVRWTTTALLLAVAIGGFYYFAEEAFLYRVLGVVAMFAAAGVVALGTTHGRRLMGFSRESRAEVRKMVWATRVETLQTSLVVFVAVIVMALFLWMLDRLLSWAISLFLG